MATGSVARLKADEHVHEGGSLKTLDVTRPYEGADVVVLWGLWTVAAWMSQVLSRARQGAGARGGRGRRACIDVVVHEGGRPQGEGHGHGNAEDDRRHSRAPERRPETALVGEVGQATGR